MTRQKLFLGPYGPTYCSKCADNVEFEQSRAVPDLSQLNQLLAIGPALELSTLGCSNTHNHILQV